MSKKSEVRTRKGQLIHTFGPGALQVNKHGISMITCGLDYWFTKDGSTTPLSSNLIITVEDKRLARKLGVEHFRAPPNTVTLENGQKIPSPLPAIRFPYWHICSNTACQRLHKISAINEDEQKCESCGAPVYQSRFVSGCINGHFQDFPWFEWLNSHNHSDCSEATCKLALVGTGSSAIAGIKVKCLTHKSNPVSLAGIFTKTPKGSGEPSSTLKMKGIACSGHSPWLGSQHVESCDQPLIGALRQATNIYFSKTDSSLKIPSNGGDKCREVEKRFDQLPTTTKDLINGSGEIKQKVLLMQAVFDSIFSPEELEAYFENQNKQAQESSIETDESYKFHEYKHFFLKNDEWPLVTHPLPLESFENWFKSYFSAVTQVKELTVTNAFYGFDRIEPQENRTIESYKRSLRLVKNIETNWLPAMQTYGEGIFLELNVEKVKEWTLEFEKNSQLKSLLEKANKSALFEKLGNITASFLLAHTFAHLLINQLIFDCGYSTASLRERLYISTSSEMEMCGILIYTAAGDSEGSLGGLVRMANPKVLQQIIRKAIESSNWCSSDPICREVGDTGGQGPSGMNLAACHNCALLPETSCEAFNSLLDRGAITSKDLSGIGYFDELLKDSMIS